MTASQMRPVRARTNEPTNVAHHTDAPRKRRTRSVLVARDCWPASSDRAKAFAPLRAREGLHAASDRLRVEDRTSACDCDRISRSRDRKAGASESRIRSNVRATSTVGMLRDASMDHTSRRRDLLRGNATRRLCPILMTLDPPVLPRRKRPTCSSFPGRIGVVGHVSSAPFVSRADRSHLGRGSSSTARASSSTFRWPLTNLYPDLIVFTLAVLVLLVGSTS